MVVITAPVIYAISCLSQFDPFVTVYRASDFRYGIPKVRRSDYLVFDRGHLAVSDQARAARDRAHPRYATFEDYGDADGSQMIASLARTRTG